MNRISDYVMNEEIDMPVVCSTNPVSMYVERARRFLGWLAKLLCLERRSYSYEFV